MLGVCVGSMYYLLVHNYYIIQFYIQTIEARRCKLKMVEVAVQWHQVFGFFR
jgi:hypothetical protein